MAKHKPLLPVPQWLRDLDIDPSILEKVRAEALKLYEMDVFSFRTPSPSEKIARRRRLRLANPWRIPPWAWWCLTMFILFTGVNALAASDFGNSDRILTMAGISIFILTIGFIVASRFQKHLLTPYFSAALRRHDIIVCPRCGYHIAYQTLEPVCPECGLADPVAS